MGLINPNIDVDAGTGDRVGSLVGYLASGTITNCYVEGGSVSGDEYAGGLLGWNGGRITNCYSTGSVSGSAGVGGLVGTNETGTISNSYSTGSVTGWGGVGGLAGENYGPITNCYAMGNVSGDLWVGGLVGWSADPITNCYSAGSVVGNIFVGGLVGAPIGAVTDSFWDIQTSGQTNSDRGTGKTTAEMHNQNTFMDAKWDFVGKLDGPHDVWAEPAGGGYPILWWQLSPLPELPTFSGGTGEPDDPYLISTATDLNIIGHNPRLMRAHFKLTNDIDLAGIDFYIIGSEAFPFTGVFDGNGKTISNFSYTSTGRNDAGLFGCVDGETAQIKDLGLIAPDVVAGTGNRVGSLVGYARGGNVTGCYAKGGRVSGSRYVGGLLGLNEGIITGCYSTGSVSGTVWDVGGLVGWNSRPGTITNCYSAGSVTGNRDAGGLVGYNEGTITNCYSTGSVSGNDGVGGLVAWNWARITNCYSAGRVVGNIWVGGLVGSTMGGAVTDSFWDIETSGQSTSAGGTGKTTAEMQMTSTFLDAGWDFMDETANGTEDIWWILEDQDYPGLTWELIEDEPTEVADPLAEALDTALSFATSGSADWFSQTTTTRYDGDAAQSGDISHNQESWIQTTVNGAGTVKFYWKVSSEEDFDFLEFYIDGSLQDRISGLVNWQQKTYTISTSGSHTLEWRYIKDGSGNVGSDCGWVDKVEWVAN